MRLLARCRAPTANAREARCRGGATVRCRECFESEARGSRILRASHREAYNVGQTRMPSAPSSTRDRVLGAFGIALLCAGVWAGWRRARLGPDYAVLHAMAVGIATHSNVYLLNDPNAVGTGVVGMVYPPAISFAVLPLAFVP